MLVVEHEAFAIQSTLAPAVVIGHDLFLEVTSRFGSIIFSYSVKATLSNF
jgi:hypothetical protein